MGFGRTIWSAYKIIRTQELQEKGYLSKLDIRCIVLKHPYQKFETYEDEIQYLVNHEQRNNFITNLALDLHGNTLILYSRVEAHGEPIYKMINNRKTTDRKTFFVHGGVDLQKEKTLGPSPKRNPMQSS